MSKYDRDSRDVYAVKRLGDEIGFGHLMAIAHEVWARELEEKGLPRKGAFCAVGYSRIKDEHQADALTDPIYKVVVERALADTPQTDCIIADERLKAHCLNCAESGSYKCKKCDGEMYFKDTPQTDCGDFAGRLAYERGVKHAWEVAQKVFDSTLTFYEAEDLAKQTETSTNAEKLQSGVEVKQTDCPWK